MKFTINKIVSHKVIFFLCVLFNQKYSAQIKRFNEDSAAIKAGIEAYAQKKYSAALAVFAEPAEKGNAVAQFFVGQLFTEGKGIGKDGQEALKWFNKSALQAYAPAEFMVGSAYYLQKKYSDAFTWIKRAADNGNADAENDLSIFYMKGIGVKEDYSEALIWLKKISKRNTDKRFMVDLSILQVYGYLQRASEAVRWVDEENRAHLYYMLAMTYMEGEYGYIKNDTIALKYLKKASFGGSNLADKKLEYMYENNRGMPEHTGGFTNLGLLYKEGKDGLIKNESMACDLFSKGAVTNDPKAIYLLGKCYESGVGAKKDLNLAIIQYEKAVELGYNEAKKDLKRLGK